MQERIYELDRRAPRESVSVERQGSTLESKDKENRESARKFRVLM